MDKHSHRVQLIHILLMAYSGELAAAYAYRGHWKSVKASDQIKGIQKIEDEEWRHRKAVGQMLKQLGRRPVLLREIKMGFIGRTIGFLCHITGWFFPMYFAGRLEHTNVKEYDTAAYHAGRLNLKKYQKELLKMAQTEQEHEDFFGRMVLNHHLLPITKSIFTWAPRVKKTPRIKKALV
jgi:demethoxyubiquinone hydroxylase (CLK1/Coq7/Cat5 family)